MSKEIEKVVEKILSLPISYRGEDKTLTSLLLKSGYLESPDAITVEMLVSALEKSPEYVDRWMMWSENKRTSSGWYFERRNIGSYVVGYYPPSEIAAQTTYTDAHVAAANFIKREIEDISKSI